MNRIIRIAAVSLPLVLAMTWGAGAANAVQPFEPNADVPWAPFVQPEPDDGPAAPVDWAPFEWDDGTPEPDPDPLPEGQPEPAPEPEPEPETVTEVAPVVETFASTAKQAQAPEDASQLRDTGSLPGTVMLITAAVLAGLAASAGVVAMVLIRRRAEWR